MQCLSDMVVAVPSVDIFISYRVMHTTVTKLIKITIFGLLPGHHKTYTLSGTYENPMQ